MLLIYAIQVTHSVYMYVNKLHLRRDTYIIFVLFCRIMGKPITE